MILLFGGTSDSRELADRLKRQGLSTLVSVVTDEAASLLHDIGLPTTVGRLDVGEMCELIQQRHIHQIVDASAPFAEIVSRTAMAAAGASGIPYCRYERPLIAADLPNVIRVPEYSVAAETTAGIGGRVLLTTGVKTLPQFAKVLLDTGGIELFVRFIPRVANMQLALDLGIKKQNILAMQGPFSADFERGLYENYSIETVVSKEGGEAGSLPSKLQAISSLGIRMVLIERPQIDYVNRFEDMQRLIEYLICENNDSKVTLP